MAMTIGATLPTDDPLLVTQEIAEPKEFGLQSVETPN